MAALVEQLNDLHHVIDVKSVQILNADQAAPENIFKLSDDARYIRSDCDAQLLIMIPFRETCKLSGISLKASGSNAPTGPKTVKIFVNQPNLDFSEAEATKPTHEFVLSATALKSGAAQELKLVKFQSVNTLTVFIVDNQSGGDQTTVSRITVSGSVRAGTNMKEFKAVG